MTLEKYHEMLTTEIITYKEELRVKRESFKTFTERHLCDKCYEDNAINDLLSIKEIRDKLEELIYQKQFVESQIRSED